MLMIASTETLRQQNRALVLSALRRKGAASHTEIASQTHLSSATVSAITTDLEAEGIIRRQEPQEAKGRGRPRVLFRQNEETAYIAALRITSALVEYSLTDYAGTLKDRFTEERPRQGDSVSAFQDRLRNGLDRLAERSSLDPDAILSISISSKGVVSPRLPILLWSPIFGDEQIDFEAVLRPRWKARILLTNETRFAAQAIAMRALEEGPVSATRKLAVLSLGHSIGLGLATLQPGQIVQSEAPSFSHMIHQVNGPLCRCGEHGCLEAYAGFYGILRNAFDAPTDKIADGLVPLETMEELAGKARSGDLRAEFAFRTAGEALGIGLSRVLSLFGLMPVTITGPGVRFLDLMQPGIEQHIGQNLYMRNRKPIDLSVVLDEENLVYDGNINTSLTDLDQNVLALGKG